MRFEGILPAVTTPFAAAGDVDHDALAANVAWITGRAETCSTRRTASRRASRCSEFLF